MYIDPKSTIAGTSTLAIRELMRKIDNRTVSLESIASYLNVERVVSENIIEKLLQEGYVEIDNMIPGKNTYYKTTLKGNSLALASAAKPLRRKTAKRKLAEFIERVQTVNSDEYYLYKVAKVILFGSYLTDKDRINDIDVAVEVLPKFEKDEQRKRNKKRIKEAEKNGKWFSSFLDELLYPEMEVLKFLKSRSRAISLHSSTDDILELVEQKVIYEENDTEPGGLNPIS